MSEVSRILTALTKGQRDSSAQLLPLVYEELRKLAAARLARETPGQTLQATALVHEAYLRLVGEKDPDWDGRGHFFAAAAEAMRRILVDNARRKKRPKHGGDLERVGLDAVEIELAADPDRLLGVHESLERLAAEHPDKAEVAKMKFFLELSNSEAAAVLGVSEKTINRHWRFAKAWLYKDIHS